MENKKSANFDEKSKERALDALLYLIINNHFLFYNLQMISNNASTYVKNDEALDQRRVL